uniref:Uncharacterized protein n=1 Tax=Toxoplasma gondii COUG TaxID=1074873 RepID=A0A2G8Y4X0_TOXGO|nr:hypothetical protein TGCOUG_392630 [Toxoplasma gondii COUG]
MRRCLRVKAGRTERKKKEKLSTAQAFTRAGYRRAKIRERCSTKVVTRTLPTRKTRRNSISATKSRGTKASFLLTRNLCREAKKSWRARRKTQGSTEATVTPSPLPGTRSPRHTPRRRPRRRSQTRARAETVGFCEALRDALVRRPARRGRWSLLSASRRRSPRSPISVSPTATKKARSAKTKSPSVG